MSDASRIEWTDASWNPLRARNVATGGLGHWCEHVSEGCRNCYAERMQPRFGNPVRYARQDRGRVEPFLDGAVLAAPLRWRRPRRVFVASMSDLFGEWVPDEWIDRMFAVMALAPRHVFQVLTKRPERTRAYVGELEARCEGEDGIAPMVAKIAETLDVDWRAMPDEWPLPNVWLGVSVEDQATAERRIPLLLDTPAAVRFVSYEPVLGPVDFRAIRFGHMSSLGRIDWIICGGESGPHARPMHPDWARGVRDQCAAARIPFFFKQWGAFVGGDPDGRGWFWYQNAAWSPNADHRFASGHAALRVGKHRAGRLLDGVLHDAIPEPQR